MPYYKDDTLYQRNEIVDYINPQSKQKYVLITDLPIIEHTCFGCFFHNIFENQCTQPRARCCSNNGEYAYIFKWLDAPKTFERFDKDHEKKKLIY